VKKVENQTPLLNPRYGTTHLYLASFLMCRGLELLGTETDGTERIRFLFANSVEVRAAAADFLANGVVEAREFSFNLLKLKKLVPRHR
jgi:hypothetical protein